MCVSKLTTCHDIFTTSIGLGFPEHHYAWATHNMGWHGLSVTSFGLGYLQSGLTWAFCNITWLGLFCKMGWPGYSITWLGLTPGWASQKKIWVTTYNLQDTLGFETISFFTLGLKKTKTKTKYLWRCVLGFGSSSSSSLGPSCFFSFFLRGTRHRETRFSCNLWPSSPSSAGAMAALGVPSNTLLLRMVVASRDPLILPSIFSVCLRSSLSLLALLDRSPLPSRMLLPHQLSSRSVSSSCVSLHNSFLLSENKTAFFHEDIMTCFVLLTFLWKASFSYLHAKD